MSLQHARPGHAAEPGEITRAALAAVPGAAHAAILRTLDRHRLTVHAPTDDIAAALDGFQAGLGQGPSRSVLNNSRPLVIEEIATEERWPRFTARAARYGIASMLCLPLLAAGRGLGTLNLYSRQSRVFTNCREMAAIFATHAALALHADAQRDHLTRTLATRDTIGQATGILMARHRHLTAEQALDRLTVASHAADLTLVEVAGWLINDTGDHRDIDDQQRDHHRRRATSRPGGPKTDP